MENELLEQVPAFSTARIDTADGTYRFTNHPANLFGLTATSQTKRITRRFLRPFANRICVFPFVFLNSRDLCYSPRLHAVSGRARARKD